MHRRHRPPARSRPLGTTLVEVLVVVATISLLVALLAPALAGARRAGEGVVCIGHMRQTLLATLGFAHDRDGALPGASSTSPDGGPPEHASWFFALAPYLELDEDVAVVARCPTDASPLWDAPADTIPRRSSFGTNVYVAGRLPGYERYAKLHAIRRPAQTIFAGELAETGPYATSDHFHPELWLVDPAEAAATQLALRRHAGAAHWSHLDGHVARHLIQDVYALDPASTIGDLRWLANRFDPAVAK